MNTYPRSISLTVKHAYENEPMKISSLDKSQLIINLIKNQEY